MWVSAADPGVSQFLHRSNGDIVVDAIGFVVRANTQGAHGVAGCRGRCGVHRGRGTRPRDGRTGVSGTIRTAVKPPRKDPVSTGRAARRLGRAGSPAWAYGPPFWNGSRPPSPFHSRRRRFTMRHQVVSLPALSCLCAVVPSCCLSPAATTPASRPTRLRWLSAPHRYWRSSPSRQFTVVDRQLQALGLRYRTGPLPRSAWRSARPDRSP